jgi:hypothetical protein
LSIQSPYERRSLEEARATFADPYRTPVSALVHAARGRAHHRRAGPRLTRALVRAMDLGFDLVFRALAPETVWRSFARHGVRARDPVDVAHLELWEVDEVADRLPSHYIAAGAALGIVVGATGRFGAILDAPLVAAVAAHAIGHYALHYGFDVRDVEERRFARDVLVAALTPVESVRAASADELVIAAIAVLRAWRGRDVGLGAWMFVRLAHRVLTKGLSRDQRASLARVCGVATAVVNAWLLFGVMRAARSAYRQRFVARR